jgi:hypothetical protein
MHPETPLEGHIASLSIRMSGWLLPPGVADDKLLSIAVRSAGDAVPIEIPELLQFSSHQPLAHWISRLNLPYTILIYMPRSREILFDSADYRPRTSFIPFGHTGATLGEL